MMLKTLGLAAFAAVSGTLVIPPAKRTPLDGQDFGGLTTVSESTQ
jgi:hypothetical protein